MSFIPSAFAARPLHTPDEYMQTFMDVAKELDMPDQRGAAVLAAMCTLQEAGADRGQGRAIWCPGNNADPAFRANPQNFPHDSMGDDGMSTGPFQQQMGPNWGWGGVTGDPEGTRKRMDMVESTRMFMGHPSSGLKRKGYRATDAVSANNSIQAVQGSSFPNAYTQWWDEANLLYDRVAKHNPGAVITPVTNRPDFNEINLIDGTHASKRSRPPINWFLHTQEGPGNAETLAHFLLNSSGSGAVSYHYTIHEDPNDHGVTVCDVVDTDLYSWSVLDANVFSINACFAGSYAAFSRDEWLAKYRNAIRVAAYLAVEDCKKYSTLSSNVILPPYQSGAGIADHRYVTNCLKIGNHTDVGGPLAAPWSGFPWDVFVADVHSFNGVPPTAPPIAVEPTEMDLLRIIDDRTSRIIAQMGPGDPSWPVLGYNEKGEQLTLRDAVGVIVKQTERD